MPLTVTQGDLLAADVPAVAHGVNTQGVMGAGVARAVRSAYGEAMFEEYRLACRLGRLAPGGVLLHYGFPQGLPDLLHLASQRDPGPDAKAEWLESALLRGLAVAAAHGHDRLGLPQVGCGIGGLDWDADVEPLLQGVAQAFPSVALEVYVL
jgi:O-acetyl-ADP-ribose deacetylase (regulator of RNase III)